ncbi:MAG: Serine/threonine exchanger SteT [Planctomycetes bacterium ADurb.Bin126]|nr:MAG: Serine/threonine exchanger SteT [Planctomycetes bacterium ADurb.Bin126]HOD84138.1 amino acid permease [Phycisphaerae bacterium]HQL76126.1 amino acid permease [Phycisphaerae bacterium]
MSDNLSEPAASTTECPSPLPAGNAPPNQVVRHLSVFDAVCLIVGIVVGAGIFALPSLVAMGAGPARAVMLAWVIGGFICLCGAMVYGELATTYGSVGGEYGFLHRAYGPGVSFLFAWARASVIQSGTIAATGYIFGIYAARLAGLGAPAPMLLALGAVAVLAACNVAGLRLGAWTQNVLTAAKVVGVAGVIVLGLLACPVAAEQAPAAGKASLSGMGFALIFVLYTFGGWNEAAYVAGELRGQPRAMLKVLGASISLITLLYLLVNLAYLRALGAGGVAASKAVAADVVALSLGSGGAAAVSLLVAISALGAIDGCIFTGARSLSAVGSDHPLLGRLGRWNERLGTPVTAIVAQSVIAAALIVVPNLSPQLRDWLGEDLEAAVAYTAPVFWTFLLLCGLSLFVLRAKDPHRERPFRTPRAPLTVGVLCLACLYMLYRSVLYKTWSPVVGLIVLGLGLIPYFASRRRNNQ